VPDIKGQDPQSNDMSSTSALAKNFGVSAAIVNEIKLGEKAYLYFFVHILKLLRTFKDQPQWIERISPLVLFTLAGTGTSLTTLDRDIPITGLLFRFEEEALRAFPRLMHLRAMYGFLVTAEWSIELWTSISGAWTFIGLYSLVLLSKLTWMLFMVELGCTTPASSAASTSSWLWAPYLR